MNVVMGIDPGHLTGIVVRDIDAGHAGLLHHDTVDRDGLDDVWWLQHLAIMVHQLLIAYGPVSLLGVENVTPPDPHLGITDPGPAITTAMAVGAVAVTSPTASPVRCVLVPPAGHGLKVPANTPPKVARRLLEQLYPRELVGPRETTGRSKTPLQHRRAAWDVAGAAPTALRILEATRS